MDGGDTVEPPLLAELLSSDRTLLLQTTPLNRRAPPGDSTGAWSRGMLTLRPMLTTATVALTLDTAMAVWATAMAAMARGLPTLRLMLTTAMVALTPDTAMAVWATAMAVSATDMAAMARDLPTLMPTTSMAVMADTDLDTPLATVMVDTATSDKSAKGWCRELQPMKICSISK